MAIQVFLLLANVDAGTAAFAQLLSESVLSVEAKSCLALSLLLQLLAFLAQIFQIGAVVPYA